MEASGKLTLTEQLHYQLSVSNPKWLLKIQIVVYQLTNGRLMSQLRGIPILLLSTTGRKSGKRRTVPLMYLMHRGRYILCASNAGENRPPMWWRNLQHHQHASIQVRDRHMRVVAHRAGADEREQLWRSLTQLNPFYSKFQEQTSREFDVVILEPIHD